MVSETLLEAGQAALVTCSLNVMQLFTAIANYTALLSETTDHMILFHVFTLNQVPGARSRPLTCLSNGCGIGGR